MQLYLLRYGVDKIWILDLNTQLIEPLVGKTENMPKDLSSNKGEKRKVSSGVSLDPEDPVIKKEKKNGKVTETKIVVKRNSKGS